jgi:hypothetical protein
MTIEGVGGPAYEDPQFGVDSAHCTDEEDHVADERTTEQNNFQQLLASLDDDAIFSSFKKLVSVPLFSPFIISRHQLLSFLSVYEVLIFSLVCFCLSNRNHIFYVRCRSYLCMVVIKVLFSLCNLFKCNEDFCYLIYVFNHIIFSVFN